MLLAMLFAKSSTIALVVAVLVSGGAIATGWLGFRLAKQLNKGRNWAITGIIIGVIGLLVSVALLGSRS